MENDSILLGLFVQEVDTHSETLIAALLNLERAFSQEELQKALRAAHSIKGAASVVDMPGVVRAAHLLEDCFDLALKQGCALPSKVIDVCLSVIDYLKHFASAQNANPQAFLEKKPPFPEKLEAALRACLKILAEGQPAAPSEGFFSMKPDSSTQQQPEASIRIFSERLASIMMISAETLIQAKRLLGFGTELVALKNQQQQLEEVLTQIQEAISYLPHYSPLKAIVQEARTRSEFLLLFLSSNFKKYELITEKIAWLCKRNYNEVLTSRMRPLSDALGGIPRLVRDLAKRLEKNITLEMQGTETLIDTDILVQLESPLSHLIRNAADHGIESPQQRLNLGKSLDGALTLFARHQSGRLFIDISDDGQGIDLEWIKQRARGLISEEVLSSLSEQELLQFLCLPGFSSRSIVTEFSGRGIGLNSVQDQAQKIGGQLHILTVPGQGSTFRLELPISRLIVHALVVIVDFESYALPLNRLKFTVKVTEDAYYEIDDQLYFDHEDKAIPVTDMVTIWKPDHKIILSNETTILVAHHKNKLYGIPVDVVLGERELVVQILDAQLGKVPNLSAVTLMPEGPPIVVLDMDDILQGLENQLNQKNPKAPHDGYKGTLLIVDDSATVRESESNTLRLAGYHIDVAVDGADAWNSLQYKKYDLLITDIDMPRLNGLDLLKRLRKDVRLKSLPVILVSYKDRPEDLLQGEQAGANIYLTKSPNLNALLLAHVPTLLEEATQRLE